MVSLWLGCIDSESALDDLIKTEYNEDGDYIPSEFAKKFSINRYDEDNRESEFYEEPLKSLESILEGFSHDKVIIPKLKEFNFTRDITEYNCAILLYDFEYDQRIKESKQKQCYLEYIGSVEYKK